MSSQADLADRYGAPRPRARMAVVAFSVVLALVFGAWLAWTAWFHATPQVSSQLNGFEVLDDHTATAVVQVDVDSGATGATCLVRATSYDHATVGEARFTPEQGRNEVTIRTEREATSVESVGCTTEDQRRPR